MTVLDGVEYKAAPKADVGALTMALDNAHEITRPDPDTGKPTRYGIAEHIVAVTGVVDHVGDVYVPGSFDRQIKRGDVRPIGMSDHDWARRHSKALKREEWMPGSREIKERVIPALPPGVTWPAEAGAAYVLAEYNLETEEGRKAYANAKFFGNEQAYSVGFKVRPGGARKRGGIRYIEDFDWFEWSDVAHGANSLAFGMSVKSREYAADERPASLADDVETKGMRYVRDPKFWGLPYGTPIRAGMRPVGETVRTLRQRGVAPRRDYDGATTDPEKDTEYHADVDEVADPDRTDAAPAHRKAHAERAKASLGRSRKLENALKSVISTIDQENGDLGHDDISAGARLAYSLALNAKGFSATERGYRAAPGPDQSQDLASRGITPELLERRMTAVEHVADVIEQMGIKQKAADDPAVDLHDALRQYVDGFRAAAAGEPNPELEAEAAKPAAEKFDLPGMAKLNSAARTEKLGALSDEDLAAVAKANRGEITAMAKRGRFGERGELDRRNRLQDSIRAEQGKRDQAKAEADGTAKPTPEFTDRGVLEAIGGENYGTDELAGMFQVKPAAMLATLRRLEDGGFVTRNAGDNSGSTHSGGRRSTQSLGWESSAGRDGDHDAVLARFDAAQDKPATVRDAARSKLETAPRPDDADIDLAYDVANQMLIKIDAAPPRPDTMDEARTVTFIRALEDNAARYGGPGAVTPGAANAARYTIEGHLGRITPEEQRWVEDYLDAHPELLTRKPLDEQAFAKREALDTQLGDALAKLAFDHFSAGEHVEALADIRAAGLVDPAREDSRWRKIRDGIIATQQKEQADGQAGRDGTGALPDAPAAAVPGAAQPNPVLPRPGGRGAAADPGAGGRPDRGEQRTGDGLRGPDGTGYAGARAGGGADRTGADPARPAATDRPGTRPGGPDEGGAAESGGRADRGGDGGVRGGEAGAGDAGAAQGDVEQPDADTAAIDALPSTGTRFVPGGVDDLAPAGKRGKLNANLAALRVLRELQQQRRAATPDEQRTLAKWAGWGGLPEVFDSRRPEYAAEREELRDLLSDKEWNEAKRNTLNAHYTDARVVSGLWATMRGLGFDGGRVLEPGSGSGNFIGFAPGDAEMVGVELDSTTAAISRALYPDATIRNESFADTNLPDGAFDATIGNVPFGQFALTDRRHNPDGESIHNHFILKSLHLTRPGGLVGVLTSRYTLDSASPAARRKMAELGDLVGAVRLPTGSHQRASGTSVIEDVLIFRRREDGQPPAADQSWITSSKREIDGQTINVNDYFTQHPDRVLGEIRAEKGQYGTGDMIVRGDRDMTNLPDVLNGIVEEARANGLTATARQGEPAGRLISPQQGRHEGHIQAEDDGSFTQAVGGAATDFQVPSSQAAELRDLIGLRDTLSSLLSAEAANSANTPEIAALRGELNRRYDAYVAEHGPINRVTTTKSGARKTPGQGGFRRDPMSAIVRALEDYDSVSGKATKTDIFTKRAVAPRAVRTTADNPADALALSLDTYGEPNLSAMAEMLGTDEADARRQLTGLVFEQPPLSEDEENAAFRRDAAATVAAISGMPVDTADLDNALSDVGESVRRAGSLETAAGYLSGNVRRKLAAARAAAAIDPRFNENVAALEKVIPPDLGPEEIDGRLGAPWIDAATVKQFLEELLSSGRGRPEYIDVSTSGGGIWTVDGPKHGNLATETWGTKRRAAPELVQALLEQRSIKVTDTVEVGEGRTKQIPNLEETLAAQAKAEEIQERFGEWLWEDPQRARRLQRAYNDQFNAVVLRSYDGSNRTFPGMSQEWRTRPRKHQRDAVERIVNEPTALLGHVVGAGKTAEMAIGAAELKRLGLARKPAIIVPNHMLEQFSREYLEIYPQAKILAAGTDDLQGDRRREFVARAATGDWDVVILTQSAFEGIPVSPEQMQAYIDREMADMRAQLAEAEANSDRYDKNAQKTIKKMEAALIRVEEGLKKKLDKDKSPGVSWEQTGIDYLFVDEAHGYSNLRTLSNIQGAGSVGSDRATDLHMKLEYLRETSRSGRVATFATGTPIRNTVSQLYVMQKFLRPDLLREAGIHSFDQWAAAFGEVVEEMELKPEGTGFRQTSRFAKFRNVPELLRLFHVFADIKLASDLKLPTPNLVGGRVENVTVPASESLPDYIAELGARAEKVRDRQVEPEEDNMLKISGDGRKAALSMRLVGGEHEPGKIEAAADRIAAIWLETKDRKYPVDPKTPDAGFEELTGALQIAFLDIGTPKTGKLAPGEDDWSGYEELRDQLVARGMPRESIRFIHEAKNDEQKAEMFAAARNGRISVLVGSSEKMGVGTNVQKRAVALHHLDAPWRPADVEQRDGRIMRQGNLNEDVRIIRYVTEGSFDAYMWQTLERKAKFINQIMKGSLDVREIEDVGDTALSYAEVKALATGNPDLLAKAKVDTIKGKLERLARRHARTQTNLRNDVVLYAANANQADADVAALERAIAKRVDTRGDKFRMTINGASLSDRAEANEAMRNELQAALFAGRYGSETRVIGTIGGHRLVATSTYRSQAYNLELRFEGVPGIVANLDRERIRSFTVATLENSLTGMERRRQVTEDRADEMRAEVALMQKRIGEEFPQQAKLEAARKMSARLQAKMERDAARADGQEIEYDPLIDSDQYDDPILGLNTPDEPPVEEPPRRTEETIPAEELAQAERMAAAVESEPEPVRRAAPEPPAAPTPEPAPEPTLAEAVPEPPATTATTPAPAATTATTPDESAAAAPGAPAVPSAASAVMPAPAPQRAPTRRVPATELQVGQPIDTGGGDEGVVSDVDVDDYTGRVYVETADGERVEFRDGDTVPVLADAPEPQEPAEPEQPAATDTIPADEVEAAEDLSAAALGLIEAEDGQLEVTADVAERQDRLETLLERSDTVGLDLAVWSDDQLGDTRTDVVAELRLQQEITRRDVAAAQARKAARAATAAERTEREPAGDTAPEEPAAEQGPTWRPGVAGGAEDLADALDAGDAALIAAARARMESGLRRSKSNSEPVQALRALLAEGGDVDSARLRELAAQIRNEARERRNTAARSRRLAKRLERERLRALLAEIDVAMRGRGLDPVRFGGPAPTTTLALDVIPSTDLATLRQLAAAAAG